MTDFYSKEELSSLDITRVPYHVAIIPDGNRRWAQQQTISSHMGHKKGSDVLQPIVEAAKTLGVRVLTLYIFSTENWYREKEEVLGLMVLLENFLNKQSEPMKEQGVRLHAIGEVNGLPAEVQDALNASLENTREGTQLDLVLALNYGGRNEICRALRTIVKDCVEERCSVDTINESLINRYLDTAVWPDPELLIRTSNEYRLSNFLLWQLSYTELYFTRVLWPEFTPKHFLEAIMQYQKRKRRRGV